MATAVTVHVPLCSVPSVAGSCPLRTINLRCLFRWRNGAVGYSSGFVGLSYLGGRVAWEIDYNLSCLSSTPSTTKVVFRGKKLPLCADASDLVDDYSADSDFSGELGACFVCGDLATSRPFMILIILIISDRSSAESDSI